MVDDVSTSEGSVDYSALAGRLAEFIEESTSDGLFPVVAFGLDPRGAPGTVAVLTAAIGDFAVSLNLVERVTHEPVSPFRFIPLATLRYIAEKNAIMRASSKEIPGFNSDDADHRKLFSRLVAYSTASKWDSRAFLLVDMVEFSRASTPEQLAMRMGLGQAIETCIRRMYRFESLGLLRDRRFNRVSTGDGFYIWSYDSASDGAVATFVLMVLLMSHTEALLHSSSNFSLRLRAAYGIGESYIFPYLGPGIVPRTQTSSGFMPDAIGPILNDLSRLIGRAAPGQILVSPFDEPGRPDRPGERLDHKTMVTRVRSEILPCELEPKDSVKAHDIVLSASPDQELRVTDKHGFVHHCYNIVGTVPYRFFRADVGLQGIGLLPDTSPELTTTFFRECH